MTSNTLCADATHDKRMHTMGQIGSLIVVGDIGDHPDEYLLDRREGVSSVENQDDDQFNTTSTSTY